MSLSTIMTCNSINKLLIKIQLTWDDLQVWYNLTISSSKVSVKSTNIFLKLNKASKANKAEGSDLFKYIYRCERPNSWSFYLLTISIVTINIYKIFKHLYFLAY